MLYLLNKGVCMAYPATADGMQQFLTYLQAKGLVNPNSIGGLKTSCEKVFSALDADERNNLGGLDAEQAIQRFMNKNPGVLSPDSATVYLSRVQRALRLLSEFNSNPTGFKVQSAKKPNGDSGGAKKPASAKKNSSGASKSSAPLTQPIHTAPVQSHSHAGSSVSLTFPLRPDFMAQFILPKDMTTKEARKLAAYFEVLAVDFEPS
jgi:hypothetical protein